MDGGGKEMGRETSNRVVITKDRFEWVLSGIDRSVTNDWEDNFLDSIEEHFELAGDLTPKQADKLEEIYRDTNIALGGRRRGQDY